MKALTLSALAAGLALAACDSAPEETASEDTMAVDPMAGDPMSGDAGSTMDSPAPTATETVTVDDSGMTPGETDSSLSVDGEDIDATVTDDGVEANIDVE